VTAVDADGMVGPEVSTSVTIANSAPTVTVTIEPDQPVTTDELAANVLVADADGDAATTSLRWTLDGNPVADLDDFVSVTADRTTRGEVWAVEALASDDELQSAPATAEVTIANSAPNLSELGLTPSGPTEGDVVTVTPGTVDDADGDAVLLLYAWTVDAVGVEGADGDHLGPEHFDKGQSIEVVVIPTDGDLSGEPVALGPIVALNTVPSATAAAVNPAEGTVETTFTCVADDWVDPDPADAESYLYEWFVDDASTSTGMTFDGAAIFKGAALHCVATPVDDESAGAPVTSSTVVLHNALPSAAVATLSPAAPAELDVLTVAVAGWSDPDGDSEDYTYAWTVGGFAVAASSSTLDGDWFARDDEVYVEVVPFDGEDSGAALTSNTVIVVNAPPQIDSAALEPDPAFTDTDLVAAVTTSDGDGDSVEVSYAWTVDGAPFGSDEPTLSSSDFERNQVVEVAISTDDGLEPGASLTLSLTVSNSPPTRPGVEVSSVNPEEDEDIICSVVEPSIDADDEGVTYSFDWWLDGASVGHTAPTLPAVLTALGDEWTCRVTPSDTFDDGPQGRASAVLGPRSFEVSWESTDTAFQRRMAVADYDGDGDADLAVATGPGTGLQLYINDEGSLALGWEATEVIAQRAVDWGDWDGDGDLDLAVSTGAADPTLIYEQGSDGSFSLAWSSTELESTSGVHWGDWDGDGLPELATANSTESVRVYGWDGGGEFSSLWSISTSSANAVDVKWVDWDGDELLDLSVGIYHGTNRMYEGDASGSLSTAPLYFGGSSTGRRTQYLQWADWEGDGDLDVFECNSSTHTEQIYRNTGTSLAIAIDSELPLFGGSYTMWAAWFDFDLDGDLDVVQGGFSGSRPEVLINDNDVYSAYWDGTPEPGFDTAHGAVADFDLDGDLDFVLGSELGMPLVLFANTGQ
jgi:hypothetical protein